MTPSRPLDFPNVATAAAMTNADSANPPATSAEVRATLAHALNMDLIGPPAGHALAEERIPGWVRPSNWYLTGFLVPTDAPPEQNADADEEEELDETPATGGLAEESAEDRRPGRRGFFPSSIGVSVLVARDVETLEVIARWGDYAPVESEDEEGKAASVWQRAPGEFALRLPLGEEQSHDVPDSGGLRVHVRERAIDTAKLPDMPPGTRAVSIFLVNQREPAAEHRLADTSYAFQAELEVRSDQRFVPRSNPRRPKETDWDERVSDLHYADTPEYATGHGVSADWELSGDGCHTVRTAWIGRAHVHRTATMDVRDTELGMDALGQLADAEAAEAALTPLVREYRSWIEAQRAHLQTLSSSRRELSPSRRETAEELLRQAASAADRIAAGIQTLKQDEDALDAFRVANRAVASALRQRLPDRFKEGGPQAGEREGLAPRMREPSAGEREGLAPRMREPSAGEREGLAPRTREPPQWRAFQLAFILLNLAGIANADDLHRETVDLLFFPTGGGKTEAYLGLAALAMVLRRLRNPEANGKAGAGVSVVMRYTLRLLTLDQLSRAAGLVCALELEREQNVPRYGEWPFEIGLWVGKAATPNVMGRRGENRSDSARAKTRQFKANPRARPAPIPLENCPWCGEGFAPESFTLLPNDDKPTELRVVCANFECAFSGERPLPVLGVDEPIYQRLPAFLIATVDKFASLPWEAKTGKLLGGADRHDGRGFYGAAESASLGAKLPQPLPPPDLVIQDELHLISGPLGTMVGLYETAIDALCVRALGEEKQARPKIVASTATARQAQSQVQALFARSETRVFPPPGVARQDSFFAQTVPENDEARLYLGIAATGRSPKVLMRRVWLALMAAAQKAYRDAGSKNETNPADPYMTVLGYFNSLRELGGARRILEEEVGNTVRHYGERKRVGEKRGLFRDRRGLSDVLELTSRVSTDQVAAARRRLEAAFHEDGHVDWAIATNMISVGLDIQRLGLMLVLGQPKSHAEYIQATSRVGRDPQRPGLVATLLSMHKPRDRSHYERFRHYHETFYRAVEVGSVTPFSARALDRGFAGALVGLSRHLEGQLTPAEGAGRIADLAAELEERLLAVFGERIDAQQFENDAERDDRRRSVEQRVRELLRAWREIVEDYHDAGVQVKYQQHEMRQRRPLLREMLDTQFESDQHRLFRANRSLRDVEPEVNLHLRELSGREISP